MSIHLVLVIVALVLFAIAAIGYEAVPANTTPRINLIALGLAFFAASFIFTG